MKKLLTILFLSMLTFSMMFAQIPAPTNLTALYKTNSPTPTGTKGVIELHWEYQLIPNTPIAFKIFKKLSTQTEFALYKSNIKSLNFMDSNFDFNKTYDYYVVAYNNSGASAPSNTASVTIPPKPDFIKFTSEPIRIGTINVPYIYDVNAKSSDSLAVIYFFLTRKPLDMTIDSLTGVINWLPTAAGIFEVNVLAKSTKGGIANHVFGINVSGPKGFIKGLVLDEVTNLPLANVKVLFYMNSANKMESAVTNQAGLFFKPIITGSYKIKYLKEGYVEEYFDNKPTLELADPVNVLANDTAVANALLAKIPPPVQYTLSGTVLNVAGLPVKAKVTALIPQNAPSPKPEPYCGRTVITDSLGNYTFTLPGNKQYIIYAYAADNKYLPEYYDNKREYAEADKVLLNENKTNINFVMDLKPVYANGISGLVKHFVGNQEGVFANVTVYKFRNDGIAAVKSVLTDTLGNYSIANLEPGKYILRAIPRFPYLPGYYKLNGVIWRWREADTVIVPENAVVPNIVINLKSRLDTGTIFVNGKVSTTFDQDVLGGIVYILNLNNEVAGYAITENNGSFTLEGLNPGTYKLEVDKVSYDNVKSPVVEIIDGNSAYNVNLAITPVSPTSVKDNGNAVPTKFELSQNYPNPFNPTTTIKYTLTEKSFISLKVYNILGKEVRTLVSEVKDPGLYSIDFKGENLNSGVYIYKLDNGKSSITRKMILLK